MPEKKMPGVMSDPWRNQKSAPPPPKPQVTPPAPSEVDPIEEDLQDAKYATIELKGYGGITAEGTNNTQIAASRLLNFCVENRDAIEPIFTQYGVIVAHMQLQRFDHIKFYIQRRDGWIVAIPDARTRDDGALQLIQAMLQVQAEPKLREKMRAVKLRAFKM